MHSIYAVSLTPATLKGTCCITPDVNHPSVKQNDGIFSTKTQELLQADSADRVSVLDLPDLNRLQDGDPDEWNKAFDWLWPTAFAVAKNKLYKSPDEVEDIAIQSITKLIKQVPKVRKVEELKRILAKITHDESVDYIRKQNTKKKGEGNVDSLDELLQEIGDLIPVASVPQKSLALKPLEDVGDLIPVASVPYDSNNPDLMQLIKNLTEELNPKERLVFMEVQANGLSYEEISQKHDIPKNSVGVYLKRAYEKLRKLLGDIGEDYL